MSEPQPAGQLYVHQAPFKANPPVNWSVEQTPEDWSAQDSSWRVGVWLRGCGAGCGAGAVLTVAVLWGYLYWLAGSWPVWFEYKLVPEEGYLYWRLSLAEKWHCSWPLV